MALIMTGTDVPVTARTVQEMARARSGADSRLALAFWPECPRSRVADTYPQRAVPGSEPSA